MGITPEDFTICSQSIRRPLSTSPMMVIWLDVGNAGTGAIAALLRSEQPRVEAFAGAADASLLILSIGAGAVWHGLLRNSPGS